MVNVLSGDWAGSLPSGRLSILLQGPSDLTGLILWTSAPVSVAKGPVFVFARMSDAYKWQLTFSQRAEHVPDDSRRQNQLSWLSFFLDLWGKMEPSFKWKSVTPVGGCELWFQCFQWFFGAKEWTQLRGLEGAYLECNLWWGLLVFVSLSLNFRRCSSLWILLIQDPWEVFHADVVYQAGHKDVVVLKLSVIWPADSWRVGPFQVWLRLSPIGGWLSASPWWLLCEDVTMNQVKLGASCFPLSLSL